MGRIAVPYDFTYFEADRELLVQTHFDPPLDFEDKLKKAYDIHSLAVRCRPYKRRTATAEPGDLHVDFFPLDADNEVPTIAQTWPKRNTQPSFGPLNVGTALREQARVLSVDHRRTILSHLPTGRGSVLSRLLEPARREFEEASDSPGGPSPREKFNASYSAAMDALRTPVMQDIERVMAETTRRTLGFMGVRSPALDVFLGIADPANPFRALRVVCRDGDLEIPAEHQGLGVQSAIVVGIFEALRQLKGDFGTIVIEEPEMYLHPQAQRYFYRLLVSIVEAQEAQVVYSTHSPVFADPVAFETTRLVRRDPGETTSVTWVSDPDDIAFLEEKRDRLKLTTGFNPTRSEALFAKRVLLVEGPGDQVAARHVAEEMGCDLDGEGFGVVECGGKSGIPFFARYLRALDIPFVVLHDEDIRDETSATQRILDENKVNRRLNSEISSAVDDPAQIFTIAPNLEEALGIGRSASDKPMRVMDKLRSMDQAEWPEALTSAVNRLITA